MQVKRNLLLWSSSSHLSDIPSGRPLKMHACISLDRYSRLAPTPVDSRTWIDTVNRLLRAKQRPDPKNEGRLKWWNYGDLAAASDVRPNTLSDIINAKRDPSIETLIKVSGALEVPPFFMLMTEEQQETYLRNADQKQQETTESALRQEMRDFFITKFNDAFETIHSDFNDQRKKTLESVTATKHKKRA